MVHQHSLERSFGQSSVPHAASAMPTTLSNSLRLLDFDPDKAVAVMSRARTGVQLLPYMAINPSRSILGVHCLPGWYCCRSAYRCGKRSSNWRWKAAAGVWVMRVGEMAMLGIPRASAMWKASRANRLWTSRLRLVACAHHTSVSG